MKVISVNHGDAFGHGSNWFTFYCPKCKKQVDPQQKKCECGCSVEWENKGAAA